MATAGTIAHARPRGRAHLTPLDLPQCSSLTYLRQAVCLARDAAPTRPAPRDDADGSESDSFRSPAAGALLAVVADHIVRGRVVFPGAGYLEMARAASVSLSGGAKSAVLSRVFFLQPLVLDGDLSTLAIGIDINAAEERFDVATEDVEAGSRTSHCAGGAATFSGALPGFSHAGLRASCAQPVAVDAMYARLPLRRSRVRPRVPHAHVGDASHTTLDSPWASCAAARAGKARACTLPTSTARCT